MDCMLVSSSWDGERLDPFDQLPELTLMQVEAGRRSSFSRPQRTHIFSMDIKRSRTRIVSGRHSHRASYVQEHIAMDKTENSVAALG